MANTEIQALIQSFAVQLEAAAKKAAIEQVIITLGGDVPWPGVGKRPGRPVGSKNVATRAPAKDMAPALLQYIRANPGSRADQIAKALQTTPDKMRRSMQTLVDSKQVKRSGIRRGTTYHVADAAPTTAPPRKARRAKRGRNQAVPAQSMRQRLVRLSARSRK